MQTQFIWTVLLLLGSYEISSAKSIWIQAVGVDTTNPAQNHGRFYIQAKLFYETCEAASLKMNKNCFLYIDLKSESYHPARKDVDPTKVTGLASKEVVLKKLKEAIASSKSGDKIILSLENHGEPSSTDPSCIYMTEKDPICSKELEKFLNENRLPDGVQLFINAEACFSSHFLKLASRNTCVQVSADNSGMTFFGQEFWSKMKLSSEPTTLKNIAYRDGVMPNGTGGGFASQRIKRELCRAKNPNFLYLKDKADLVKLESDLDLLRWQIDGLNNVSTQDLRDRLKWDRNSPEKLELNNSRIYQVLDQIRKLKIDGRTACASNPRLAYCPIVDQFTNAVRHHEAARQAFEKIQEETRQFHQDMAAKDRELLTEFEKNRIQPERPTQKMNENRRTYALRMKSWQEQIDKNSARQNSIQIERSELLRAIEIRKEHQFEELQNILVSRPDLKPLESLIKTRELFKYICIPEQAPPPYDSRDEIIARYKDLPDWIYIEKNTYKDFKEALTCEESFSLP